MRGLKYMAAQDIQMLKAGCWEAAAAQYSQAAAAQYMQILKAAAAQYNQVLKAGKKVATWPWATTTGD